MKKISDFRAVMTSALVDVSDVVLNLVVALITGSTVMLSQALQGVSDLVTSGILLLGVKRSRKAADERYQFGYGREIFFWVLIAGILMFLGTGAYSVYLGYRQVVNLTQITNTWLAMAMLGFGFTTNSYAFWVSLRRIRQLGDDKSWWQHIFHSSIVETKATILTDFLGSSASVIGILAILTYIFTDNLVFDGIGSALVGFIMMIGAALLIKDVRDLIVGKAVDEAVAKKIVATTEKINEVETVLDIRTMYLGSAKLLVIIEVHLKDELSTDEIELITDKIKAAVHKAEPLVQHVQVEVETPEL